MSAPRPAPGPPHRLLVFGWGGVGQALGRRMLDAGWAATATVRAGDGVPPVDADVATVSLGDPRAVDEAVAAADAVLVTAPPDETGCPGLAALASALRASVRRPWIGYLSTTGVYGDHGGRWVFEETPLAPLSTEALRRAAAEAAWTGLAAETGASLAIFRLPGLYGPGRSALDRVRAGDARRLVKPGQLFSRLHLDDAAAGIAAAIARPRAGAVFNLCDDLPAPNADVTAYAAALLGAPAPPEEPVDLAALSPAARRFWSESKRVSNALAKAELGWRPAYPTYREGLAAILQGR